MKTAVVLGASGLIGGHMAKYLKSRGYWVRGVDIRLPEYFGVNNTRFDEFLQLDLRDSYACWKAMHQSSYEQPIDEVYQLAAQMGGMGYISKEHLGSLYDSNLINTNVPEVCVTNKVGRLFFSSSVCVYPVHRLNAGEILTEEDAMPANPNEAYGWEKLTAEMRYQAYAQERGLKVRIARFDNCYGEDSVYDGGREKAPAALCRKVSLAKDGGSIEIWGDGTAVRHFIYVEDLVIGIYKLMQSDYNKPLNLGADESMTIGEFAQMIIDISGKKLKIKHIKGPVGAQTRLINHEKARKILKWQAETSFKEGLSKLYIWIQKQNSQV